MKTVILSLFEQHPLLEPLAAHFEFEIGRIRLKSFPDQESLLQFETDLEGKNVIILNSLGRPDAKMLPLIFAAETARDLGAKKVGLCAPYLCYMRQDKRFHRGEAVTSTYFADLVSHYFDGLVTVDPHLHRRHSLSEIYSIPNSVQHAAPRVSEWISEHIPEPLLIGPDSESEQWVKEVALAAGADFLILEKIRHGDRDVEISKPAVEHYLNYTPVLVDDIISSAQTMIESVRHLRQAGMKPPVCIGVHPVFADDAYQMLLNSGVEKVVSCNTIPHPSNQIDLFPILSQGIMDILLVENQ